MERFHISFDGWQDKLDCCWKQLPPEKKRRVVLYSFAGYLLITIAIIVQVIYEMGNAPDKIGIEHIHNPVAKPQTGAESGTSIQKFKTEDNERGEKKEGKLSGE